MVYILLQTTLVKSMKVNAKILNCSNTIQGNSLGHYNLNNIWVGLPWSMATSRIFTPFYSQAPVN